MVKELDLTIHHPNLVLNEEKRSDAIRNHNKILKSATILIDEYGVDSVSMDLIAKHANVGKGTIFRRFGSRSGLLFSLLDKLETEFQNEYIYGDSTLGPNSDPLTRLIAFGHGRINLCEKTGEILKSAMQGNRYTSGVINLCFTHIRMLLDQLDPDKDNEILSYTLMNSLDPEFLLFLHNTKRYSYQTIREKWAELVKKQFN